MKRENDKRFPFVLPPDEEPFAPKQVLKDTLLSLSALAAATLLGALFDRLGFTSSNVMMAYLLGVLAISVATSHRIYSLISSIAAVFLFNFFFVYPRLTLRAYEVGYPVTFVVMFFTAFLTATLAIQRKRITREREAAAVQMEKERLRSMLLRSISHDLRSPLTSISGHASNLLSHGEEFDAATRRRIYEDIEADSRWLMGLVENLLMSTRLEDDAPLNLSTELVEDIFAEALNHVSAEESRGRIRVETPEELLFVRCDAQLIVQLLVNLLDNAVKYTPPETEILLRAVRRGGCAELSVADLGSGVPDHEKEHIFEMFYVGEHPVSDGRRGLGFGLALCKTIAEVHGGTIAVSDNVPHGAIFTLTLKEEEMTLHG